MREMLFAYFTSRKQILTKIQDRDVSLKGMFSKEIQDTLLTAPSIYQVIHDQDAAFSSMIRMQPFGSHLDRSLNSRIPS